MPSSNLLGQLLLMGVPGPELDAETAARLKKLQPGGFILFGRNIQSPAQLRKLIDDLRDISDIEPFITIDQEGGRVSRLRLIGEEPPNAQSLRDKGDPELIKRHGKLTGQVLRQFHLHAVSIELNQTEVDKCRQLGLPVIYGDASQPFVLRAAHVKDAALVLITIA